MAAIEVYDPSRSSANRGDDAMAIACQNNLRDMVDAIRAKTQLHSIDVLRITSPGIIAILIGLLLPAIQKVREAAARPTSQPSALKKVREAAVEQSLKLLRPHFAPGAQVEIRADVAVGDINGDGLIALAKAFGVPVLIGRANAEGSWIGPVKKAMPQGGPLTPCNATTVNSSWSHSF